MHDMKHPSLAQKSLNGKINIKKIGMAINQDVDPPQNRYKITCKHEKYQI